MSLFSGLRAALCAALLSGLGASCGSSGPTQLADFDFRTPATAWSAGFEKFTSPVATSEWVLESYSGGYASNTGGGALVDNGSTSGLQDRWTGIFNGTDYDTVQAWEQSSDRNARLHVTANTTEGNAGTASFAGRVVFRCPRYRGSNDFLVSKSQVGGGNPGWWIITQFGSGGFTIRVGDGANSATLDVDGDFWDGAPHYIAFWIDRATNTLFARSDLGGEVSTSIAAVTGNISSSDGLTVGQLHGATVGNGIPAAQVVTVSLCTDSNHETHYNEDFWRCGADPSGYIDAGFSRGCSVGYDVNSSGNTAMAASPQLLHGYHSAFTHASKLALVANDVMTNYVTYSEELSNWTATTATVTDYAADGSFGARTASTVQAGATNDVIRSPSWSATGNRFMARMKLREVTAGATGRLIIYNNTTASEVASSSFTASSSLQTISCVTATPPTSGHSIEVRIEIDTSGHTVTPTEVMAYEVRSGSTPVTAVPIYLRTSGGTKTSTVPDWSGTNKVQVKQGEIKTTMVQLAQRTIGEGYYTANSSGTVADAKEFFNSTIPIPLVRVYDTSGTQEDSITGSTFSYNTEYVCRQIYDVGASGEATGGYEQVWVQNGVTTNGAASPPEGTHSTTGTQKLRICENNNGTIGANFLVARIQTWDDKSEAIP